MNRARKIRRMMVVLGESGIRAEADASHTKLMMLNVHGRHQHRCINPVRQMKNRVAQFLLTNKPGR
jgi:hypothetical protein